jgi:putative methyltransferase (TIGR04325 family)
MNLLKKVAKNILPPVISKLFRKSSILKQYGFFGNYASWQEANALTKGYDEDLILNKVKIAIEKVKNGKAIYERDSVLFDKIEYSFPVLAGFLRIAAVNGNKLNVLDFGGSLGSSYFQNRRFLDVVQSLTWNIVEQSHFVDCGQKNFQNEELKFYYSIEECKKDQNPDVIFFSSVLQYLEEPCQFLESVINQGFDFIIFDRTPFLEDETLPERITVQRVPPSIYDASYPAWFFNSNRFLQLFKGKYELLTDFDSFETWELGDVSAKNRGFIFERIR